ncbi:MAG TPA: 5-deoxy-glucuronate isomerase [Ktedonobacterales bacterium]|nr:5-deoxy-glucuronate isomerase [Ktedonobacterales bacterium]
MNLRLHDAGRPGYTELVTPATHPVERITFGVLRLDAGASHTIACGRDEVGLIVLSGTFDARVGDQTFTGLGGRPDVFAGRATGVYLPRGARATLSGAAGGASIAVCRCAAQADLPVQVIRPEQVVAHDVGGPGFRRYVHDILGPQMRASVMLIGETFTPAGNWSSYPPHKHDVEALPEEVRQEELYYYQVRPERGFGLQYLYTPDGSPHGALDQALAVRHRDVTLMPYGYHPVAAPPGYDLYYLWFLAGATRLMRPHDDPAHAWVKDAPDAPRTYPT